MTSTRSSAAVRLNSRPVGGPSHHPGAVKIGMLQMNCGTTEHPESHALVYVPSNYSHIKPVPLIVLCHGAGGDNRNAMGLLQGLADTHHVALLATSSIGRSWDMISGKDFGPDVKILDKALGQVFGYLAIDPSRIAIGGFSDGGSYALSMGCCNGDLFTHVIAFSPGFMSTPAEVGSPKVYVSHGRADRVLAIDRCSQRIVPKLRGGGYEVKYHEFDGPHTVPGEVASEALEWMMKTPSTSPLHQTHAHRFA